MVKVMSFALQEGKVIYSARTETPVICDLSSLLMTLYLMPDIHGLTGLAGGKLWSLAGFKNIARMEFAIAGPHAAWSNTFTSLMFRTHRH